MVRSAGNATIKSKVDQRRESIEKLLAAALRLFVTLGYNATNLEKVAGAAGLTKGAVYFYFGSKEALLVEVLKHVRTVVLDGAIEAMNSAGPGCSDKIVAFLHHAANLSLTHRDEVFLLILMSLEFKEREGEIRTTLDNIYDRLHKLIERVVRAGQRNGEFRGDLKPRELSAFVMATHDGTFLEWYRRPEALKDKELVRVHRAVVVAGMHHAAASLTQVRPRKRAAVKPGAAGERGR